MTDVFALIIAIVSLIIWNTWFVSWKERVWVEYFGQNFDTFQTVAAISSNMQRSISWFGIHAFSRPNPIIRINVVYHKICNFGIALVSHKMQRGKEHLVVNKFVTFLVPIWTQFKRSIFVTQIGPKKLELFQISIDWKRMKQKSLWISNWTKWIYWIMYYLCIHIINIPNLT